MKRGETAAWTLGGTGAGVALLGWLLDPARFHLAWIAAMATWWAWPLGSIALLLIHRLTGGAWGIALNPALRAGAATAPLLLPAIVPVLLGLSIYPWTHADMALTNRGWLDVPFLLGRIGVYLVSWIGLAALTVRRRRQGSVFPALGLMGLAFTFTFASIDLVLSLAPRFNSSVFGLIQGAAAVLFALSLAAIPATFAASRAALADIARLMLALVVLWAYLDFMQFLIVWESNLPNEAAWYGPRMHGGWGHVFAALAACHFLLPLLLLMVPRVQRSRRGMASIAGVLVMMEVVRGWWIVLPQRPGGVGWIEIACTLAFAGIGAGSVMRAHAHV